MKKLMIVILMLIFLVGINIPAFASTVTRNNGTFYSSSKGENTGYCYTYTDNLNGNGENENLRFFDLNNIEKIEVYEDSQYVRLFPTFKVENYGEYYIWIQNNQSFSSTNYSFPAGGSFAWQVADKTVGTKWYVDTNVPIYYKGTTTPYVNPYGKKNEITITSPANGYGTNSKQIQYHIKYTVMTRQENDVNISILGNTGKVLSAEDDVSTTQIVNQKFEDKLFYGQGEYDLYVTYKSSGQKNIKLKVGSISGENWSEEITHSIDIGNNVNNTDSKYQILRPFLDAYVPKEFQALIKYEFPSSPHDGNMVGGEQPWAHSVKFLNGAEVYQAVRIGYKYTQVRFGFLNLAKKWVIEETYKLSLPYAIGGGLASLRFQVFQGTLKLGESPNQNINFTLGVTDNDGDNIDDRTNLPNNQDTYTPPDGGSYDENGGVQYNPNDINGAIDTIKDSWGMIRDGFATISDMVSVIFGFLPVELRSFIYLIIGLIGLFAVIKIFK